jgi:hypothetical protein
MLVLNIFLIFVGMIMEIFAAIIVAVPLVLPLARAYGLDPYHFAIIFLLNPEIAYLMPPLGINLFISSIRFGRPVTYLYRTVLVFIGVLFATLMVVCYVPSITTWMPSLIKSDDIAEEIRNDAMQDHTGESDDDLKGKDFGMNADELAKLNQDGGTNDILGGDDKDAGADAGTAKDAGAKADGDKKADDKKADEKPAAK